MFLTKIRFIPVPETSEYMGNDIFLKDIVGRTIKELRWSGTQDRVKEESINSFVAKAELHITNDNLKHTLEFHQPLLKRTWKYPGMTEGEPYVNSKILRLPPLVPIVVQTKEEKG